MAFNSKNATKKGKFFLRGTKFFLSDFDCSKATGCNLKSQNLNVNIHKLFLMWPKIEFTQNTNKSGNKSNRVPI